MDQDSQNGPTDRKWTLMETHTLLDLIRDMGLRAALTRKGHQNWDIFKRLHVLLGRCSVRVRTVDIKAHWQFLKGRFWRLKHLADTSLVPLTGLTADFPFYEEMEQLLTQRAGGVGCKREADSTGQEESTLPPSMSDSGFLLNEDDEIISHALSHPEEERRLESLAFRGQGAALSMVLQKEIEPVPPTQHEPYREEYVSGTYRHNMEEWGSSLAECPQEVITHETVDDRGPRLQKDVRFEGEIKNEFPRCQPTVLIDDLSKATALGGELRMLHEDMRLLQTAMQQLQGVMEKIVLGLSRLEEQVSVQLGYLSSLAGNVTAPTCSAGDAPKETPPSTHGQQTSRALRRSLRRKKPYFSDLGK